MTHAGCYDPSILQDEHKTGITSVTATGNKVSLVGIARSVSNVTYNNDTGLMVITTHEPHEFKLGKYLMCHFTVSSSLSQICRHLRLKILRRHISLLIKCYLDPLFHSELCRKPKFL